MAPSRWVFSRNDLDQLGISPELTDGVHETPSPQFAAQLQEAARTSMERAVSDQIFRDRAQQMVEEYNPPDSIPPSITTRRPDGTVSVLRDSTDGVHWNSGASYDSLIRAADLVYDEMADSADRTSMSTFTVNPSTYEDLLRTTQEVMSVGWGRTEGLSTGRPDGLAAARPGSIGGITIRTSQRVSPSSVADLVLDFDGDTRISTRSYTGAQLPGRLTGMQKSIKDWQARGTEISVNFGVGNAFVNPCAEVMIHDGVPCTLTVPEEEPEQAPSFEPSPQMTLF